VIATDASILRLYLNADDRRGGRPLYRTVVERARSLGLAGASVFPAELGFGAHRRVHDAASDYAFVSVPVVIEVVDAPGRIAALLDELGPMVGEGLAVVRPAALVAPGGANPMPTEVEARRVTVYIGSSDTWHGRNLALAIVERCRALGLSGATASRGIMGFGKNSVIHRAHLLGLSEDLPERVEIIDHPDRIGPLLPILDEMVQEGLIVVEDVGMIRYGGHP
jgi:PII-like signaling protein